MAAPVDEKRRPHQPVHPLVLWGGLLALVVIGFVAVVVALNATVYSAGGFVRGYLDALNRGDTRAALTMAGVTPSDKPQDMLLAIPQTDRFTGLTQLSDQKLANGSRRIVVRYRTSSASRPGPSPAGHGPASSEQTTQFVVRPAGAIGGLFDRWAFAISPTASLDLTVAHDRGFTANGAALASPEPGAVRYRVLAPSSLVLGHSSRYLTAAPVEVVTAQVGSVTAATVDIEPRSTFTDAVRSDITTFLRTKCLPQQVLLPSGCPFGTSVNDRVTSAPRWTMPHYPPVRLVATDIDGTWRVAPATGHAHLTTMAQSLYDGHSYRIDQDVPFRISYSVVIGADDRLTLTPLATPAPH